MKKIEVLGLESIPEIKQGNNLAEIIANCSNSEIGGLQDNDIIVLTSKIVSKALGRIRKLSQVKPDRKALLISKKTGKDARWLQMIFDEGHKILAIIPLKGILEHHIMQVTKDRKSAQELIEHEQAICITIGKDGRIHTCDAGIDGSNHPPDIVSLLPQDPDAEAKKIRQQLAKITGKKIAVILADTEIIPYGTIDFAVGASGMKPISAEFGQKDLFGKPKFGGIDLIAYELTAASTLLFGQTVAGVPVAVIRGYHYQSSETENISNTLLPQTSNADTAKVDFGKTSTSSVDSLIQAVKATMRATSYACRLKTRILLKISSWFV